MLVSVIRTRSTTTSIPNKYCHNNKAYGIVTILLPRKSIVTVLRVLHVVVSIRVVRTTARSICIPSDPRTQTTVPACQTDRNMCSVVRKTLILKSLCQSFVLPSYDRGLFRPPHQPRAPRGKAMGHVVYKPLLGAADTNHSLSTHKWVMSGNVQQLIQVRKWLRGLPDAVPHSHARHHDHGRPESKMVNF